MNWHERNRLGQKFLCKHTLEQIKMFICTNFTKLNNVVELFTVEDMEAVFKREEVNCTTGKAPHHPQTLTPVASSRVPRTTRSPS